MIFEFERKTFLKWKTKSFIFKYFIFLKLCEWAGDHRINYFFFLNRRMILLLSVILFQERRITQFFLLKIYSIAMIKFIKRIFLKKKKLKNFFCGKRNVTLNYSIFDRCFFAALAYNYNF